MTQDVPALRDPAAYAERVILTAGRAVRNAFDARFSRLQLSMTEGALLATIQRFGPLTQRELAELLYIGRAAASNWLIGLSPRISSIVRSMLDVEYIVESTLPCCV